MQIQVNIDITIVLIAIVQLIRVIIIIHEEKKSANHPLTTGLALLPNPE